MNYIERLIEIGYLPEQARRILDLYERQCDLDGLDSFISAKESIREVM